MVVSGTIRGKGGRLLTECPNMTSDRKDAVLQISSQQREFEDAEYKLLCIPFFIHSDMNHLVLLRNIIILINPSSTSRLSPNLLRPRQIPYADEENQFWKTYATRMNTNQRCS